ncbi:TetR/AcrR family transcriptional regulator [Conexibacter woesei]|uniref:Transcriptional regulator, TetR family n=1 Tax=Conexibacter woesei (strain DSM 14684 / CCUG 47730 / CIP 108061 / JCM 11494 / NBRC 100937 / ID131577) TaxID=469383 RepID=D3F866_CONWI|nr:TetR/AcrR family transcriptional regulator [Conexibacter woesei]ADB48936.1 transcriptional regulator, TetR family [Conexibacter woesei DSM 14684]
MASRPATAKGRATHTRLLDAATAELLARDGDLELTRVAHAAQVSPSVVYHHVGGKAELIGAVVESFYGRLHAEVLDDDLTPLGDWPTREHERLRRGVAFHYREPLAPVLYGRMARDPALAALEARLIAQVVDASARNIRAAQRAGELPSGPDPALAGAAIFGAMRQVLLEALGRARRPAMRGVVEQLWRVTAAAVSIPSERTSR